jgi:dGTPase
LAAFIGAMIDATETTGRIGMTTDHSEALAAFRAFNYERIYLRPESREQASLVVTMLQGLVEFLAADATRLPARLLTDDSEEGTRRASVEWVAGMTDRYAQRAAVAWLGLTPDQLPQGIN